MKHKLYYFWLLITFRVGPVMFVSPGIERYFARCTNCGRVFMHYWGCVTAADRENGRQVGCKCGGMKMRIMRLPVAQQAWFLLTRLVWRKWIRRERYWDPRMPAMTNAPQVKNKGVA